MNYKDIYIKKYRTELKKLEDWTIDNFLDQNNKSKTFRGAYSFIDNKLRKESSSVKYRLVASENYGFLFAFEDRNTIYTGSYQQRIQLILENEIFELFQNNDEVKDCMSFHEFLVRFGEYKAKKDAYTFFRKLESRIEYLYNKGKIEELELREEYYIKFRNPEIHSKVKNEGIEKINEKKIYKEEKYDKLISNLTKDEKIVILSEFMSMPSTLKIKMHDTEIARILFISMGVMDIRLFTTDSKQISYLTKFRNGIHYYKNKRKKQKLIQDIYLKTSDLRVEKFREYIMNMEL